MRNGRATIDRAYNGTCHNTFYMTPGEFYEGGDIPSDPADTTKRGSTAVLDRQGTMRLVRDSGHRVFFPKIPGVGTLRQRYPIMPVYGEGSSVWKELEALKDIVLDYNKYRHMYRSEMPQLDPNTKVEATDDVNRGKIFELAPGQTGHSHLIRLSVLQVEELAEGRTISVIAEESDGHEHELSMKCVGRNRHKCFTQGRITPYEPHSNKLIDITNPEDDSDQ